MNSLIGNLKSTQQPQGSGGGLFSNISTSNAGGNSLFSGISNNNTQSLFGQKPNINTNTATNVNNALTNDGKSNSLLGNNLFGNIGSNVNNSNTNSNTNSNKLFSNNTNAPPANFGNFQNNSNTNTNNDKPKEQTSSIFPSFNAPNTLPKPENKGNIFETGFGIKKEENTQQSLFKNTQGNMFTNNSNQTQSQNNANDKKPALGMFNAPLTQDKKNENNNQSLFGLTQKKENENNPQTQTQTQTQSQKQPQILFGNNIDNKSQQVTNSLFSQKSKVNPSQEQNKPALNINPINQNQNKEEIINTSVQNNNQNNNNNINQQNPPKENEAQNPNINDINNPYIKVPDKPFELSLSNSKELEEFEKNQLMHRTNKEIIDDFKKMLDTQKAKFQHCVNNTRKFESKLMSIIEITNDNALMSEINEKNGQKIIGRIESINYRSKNLENIITLFNEKLGNNLTPYKDNIMNSDKFLLNQNDSAKFKFYENFAEISDKCYNIENSLNEAEQNLAKKEKEINEKNREDNDGVWIERNKGKIFVNQNEVNNLFSECFDGLANLKSMQDTIDKNYEILKEKIMRQNNYNYNINNNNYY